jgi:C4-dicarboxylate-specific signal transduction histidine kinase
MGWLVPRQSAAGRGRHTTLHEHRSQAQQRHGAWTIDRIGRKAAASAPEGIVRRTVADAGEGIAPEVMARLFEPFVTTKAPDKGAGLGLPICHGLVKGMGGSIDAHANAEGAVFTTILQAA